MITEYWSLGSMDEAEGLTTMLRTLDDDGNIVCGYSNPASFYKAKPITKDEYDAINEWTGKRGFFGIVSATGYQKYLESVQQNIDRVAQALASEIEKVKTVVTKLQELGLIQDNADMIREIRIRLPALPASQIAEIASEIGGGTNE